MATEEPTSRTAATRGRPRVLASIGGFARGVVARSARDDITAVGSQFAYNALLATVPFLFIVLPLLSTIPVVYSGLMRFRVMRHYGEIRSIDAEAQKTESAEQLRSLRRRLTEIEETITSLTLPAAYRDMAYTAQIHINLVRQRIDRRLLVLDVA